MEETEYDEDHQAWDDGGGENFNELMQGGIRAPEFVLDKLGGLLPRLNEDPEFFKSIIGQLYEGLDDDYDEEEMERPIRATKGPGVFTQMFNKAFRSTVDSDD